MKMIFCKLCGRLLQLETEPKSCDCGNVYGYYSGRTPTEICVDIEDIENSKILAIQNRFLMDDVLYHTDNEEWKIDQVLQISLPNENVVVLRERGLK